MSYRQELDEFEVKHPYKITEAGGAQFHYVLEGEGSSQTLVFLNGGMNVSRMWMRYVDNLAEEFKILIFDYPYEAKTNAQLIDAMDAFLKKLNIKKPVFVGASDGKGESEENKAYIKELFTELMKDYTKEKDMHITGLLADLLNQSPVTADTFVSLSGKIMLILPDHDFFSEKMQKKLVSLMHDPEIKYISGSHISTVLKADEYSGEIRSFTRKIR